MNRSELLRLTRAVLTIPTAPYHEHGVRQFVINHCRQLGLRPQLDRGGNVIVRGTKLSRRAGPPLVLVAHMDHPGFEALGGRQVEFLGGVPPALFRHGRIRFDRQIVRIVRVVGRNRLRVSQPVPRGAFGMWDVPAFQVRADKLRACAIDDVLSVAVVLATLTEVVRRRLATHLWAVFTRAEEVGFHGAVDVACAGVIPRSALVVSMEMSKERPWARQGQGPVIRVGDRLTMFDPGAAWYLTEVARAAGVTAQRALMDGGACEASAFAGFGYRVGGLCLPLGNYHNIGPGLKPRAEYVDVRDLEGLVRLTVAAAADWRHADKLAGRLRARILRIRRQVPRRLTRVVVRAKRHRLRVSKKS